MILGSPYNIQQIPTPILWLGSAPFGYEPEPGADPGLQESESGEFIYESEEGDRLVPSQH